MRRGVSMIEVQAAMVIFGLALSGLAPCMVMYTKHLRSLEQRFDPGTTYYLVPAGDLWSRKLGIAATVTSQAPEAPSGGTISPTVNAVEIVSVTKSLANQQASAHVTVQTSP
ncbi:MAG TPA: hypothetical protein VHZ24_19725 [Pirellulales bacterium]|jgi:hypothetical protein|nr:hypothetical protein [Pirellulales bacterium]